MLSLPKMLKKITLELEDIRSKIGSSDTTEEEKQIHNVSLSQVKTSAAKLLDISWDAPQGVGVSYYRVLYSYNGADYTEAVECTVTTTQIELPEYGEVYIKIVAFSKFRDVSTYTGKIILRKMSGAQNEVEVLSVAQMGNLMYFIFNGKLSTSIPGQIEFRVDGDNWDDAITIGTSNNFPVSIGTYLSAGNHIFRARTNNDGVYGKKEKTFSLKVRNEYEDGDILVERDDIDNLDFNMANMLRVDNKIFSPWYLRFDNVWDKDFDTIRHITLETIDNYDSEKNINMAPLSFESIWNETLDNKYVYDSYFQIAEELSSSGMVSPVVDLGSNDIVQFDYDFVCNMLVTSHDSTVSSQDIIKPTIYIRYSEDNETWSDWQLFIKATFKCQYVQYKLMFTDMKQIDNMEISKLYQKYTTFNDSAGGVDLNQVLNNILVKIN